MSDVRYVRLKPHNPKRGINVKRYHCKGHLFIDTDGSGNPRWYRLDKKACAYLSTLHQEYGNEESPKLFDILTEDEWKRTANHERNMRLVELGMASPAALQAGVEKAMAHRVDEVTPARAAALVDDEPPPEVAPKQEDSLSVEEVQPGADITSERSAEDVELPSTDEPDSTESSEEAVKEAPRRGRGRPSTRK